MDRGSSLILLFAKTAKTWSKFVEIQYLKVALRFIFCFKAIWSFELSLIEDTFHVCFLIYKLNCFHLTPFWQSDNFFSFRKSFCHDLDLFDSWLPMSEFLLRLQPTSKIWLQALILRPLTYNTNKIIWDEYSTRHQQSSLVYKSF